MGPIVVAFSTKMAPSEFLMAAVRVSTEPAEALPGTVWRQTPEPWGNATGVTRQGGAV